jgi:hypothetical protein
MMRFLTDQLQEAEDAGDRGVFCFEVFICAELLMNLFSMDHGTCTLWLGWFQSIIGPDQFV